MRQTRNVSTLTAVIYASAIKATGNGLLVRVVKGRAKQCLLSTILFDGSMFTRNEATFPQL